LTSSISIFTGNVDGAGFPGSNFHKLFKQRRTAGSSTPNRGITVADVALTNVDCCSIVGCAVLKLMSKLSYANTAQSVHTVDFILMAVSLERLEIALWIKVKLIDKPACERVSITFSGTCVE
jgi:hypothetical protein